MVSVTAGRRQGKSLQCQNKVKDEKNVCNSVLIAKTAVIPGAAKRRTRNLGVVAPIPGFALTRAPER
jgi:hypothetical protein